MFFLDMGTYFLIFLEITFLRKDQVHKKILAIDFPHHLDRKNVLRRRNIILPKYWYG